VHLTCLVQQVRCVARLAAIGPWMRPDGVMQCCRWVAYHGLALNVCTDLSPFRDIVPCGIQDKPVGSVAGLLLQQQQQRQEELSLEQQLATNNELLREYRYALLDSLSEVFGLDLTVDEEATACLVAAEIAVQH
jgi:hypothetical protein